MDKSLDIAVKCMAWLASQDDCVCVCVCVCVLLLFACYSISVYETVCCSLNTSMYLCVVCYV